MRSMERPRREALRPGELDPDHVWRILPIGSTPDGALWYWERHSRAGALVARSAGFQTHGACLDDAIAHGYLAAALSPSDRPE